LPLIRSATASRASSAGIAAARRELAAEFLDDLRGIDAKMRDARKKLAVFGQGLGHKRRGLRRRPGRRR